MLRKTPGYAIAFVVAGLVIIIDQGSKVAAVTGLSETERIPLLGDLLGLQLAFNPGAILSFGSDVTWLLTTVGVVVIAFLFVAAHRSRTSLWATGIGFVLGGAIGNVLDRLFAPPAFGRGHVTDFLAYGNWFVGNLADIALGIGAIILALAIWRRRNARRATRAGVPIAAQNAEA